MSRIINGNNGKNPTQENILFRWTMLLLIAVASKVLCKDEVMNIYAAVGMQGGHSKEVDGFHSQLLQLMSHGKNGEEMSHVEITRYDPKKCTNATITISEDYLQELRILKITPEVVTSKLDKGWICVSVEAIQFNEDNVTGERLYKVKAKVCREIP